MALQTRYRDFDLALAEYQEWYEYNQTRVTSLHKCVEFLRYANDGRLFILELLRDRIMALRDAYTNVSDLNNALYAFRNWYETQKDEVRDPLLMLSFLKKATDDSLHLLQLMCDTVQALQIKPQLDRPNLIVLPY